MKIKFKGVKIDKVVVKAEGKDEIFAKKAAKAALRKFADDEYSPEIDIDALDDEDEDDDELDDDYCSEEDLCCTCPHARFCGECDDEVIPFNESRFMELYKNNDDYDEEDGKKDLEFFKEICEDRDKLQKCRMMFNAGSETASDAAEESSGEAKG